jgi:uncharacterized protein YidB (DUF937 family)
MGLVESVVGKYGGDLNQLVSKFDAAGLGDKVKSWISTGENQPISKDEVEQALGDDVNEVAQRDGVTPDEAADKLANDLPNAVDKATPDGTIPSADEMKKALTGLAS